MGNGFEEGHEKDKKKVKGRGSEQGKGKGQLQILIREAKEQQVSGNEGKGGEG